MSINHFQRPAITGSETKVSRLPEVSDEPVKIFSDVGI